MKEGNKFYIWTIFSILGLAYIAYYLLLSDNFLHISIGSIVEISHGLTVGSHLIILTLLPIYVATMVFGSGLLGILVATKLQNFFRKQNK